MCVEYRKYLFLCKIIIFYQILPSLFFNYILFYEKAQNFKFFSIFISNMILNIPFYIVAFFTFQNITVFWMNFVLRLAETTFLPG